MKKLILTIGLTLLFAVSLCVANEAGNITEKSFMLRVAQGEVAGYSMIDKFGENPEVTTGTDPEDIWDGGATYNFTAAGGADYYISSSSDTDTQDIRIYLLTVDSNNNWNNEVFIQAVSGNTKVLLVPPSGDKPIRIYRAENMSASNVSGVVYIYEDDTVVDGVPDTAGEAGSKVKAQIVNGNNQTLMCVYTIPTGFVGFLMRGEVGISRGGGVAAACDLSYRSRREGKVFKVKKKLSLNTQGSSTFQDVRSRPDPIPEKTDIVIRADEVSATIGLFATLDILLVEKRLLNNAFLTALQ